MFKYETPAFIGDVLVPRSGEVFVLDGVRWTATGQADRGTRTVARVHPDGHRRWWPVAGIGRAHAA